MIEIPCLVFPTEGVSTDAVRKKGNISGLVRRLSKRRLASRQLGHQGLLSGVYADAIEINGGSQVAAGGYITTIGLIGGFALTCFVSVPLFEPLVMESSNFWLALFGFVSGILLLAFSTFWIGIYFEMFSPAEQPIFFDRKHRKVYYVQRSARRRFILFGPSTVEARSVDWDLVDAEHHAKLRASTASVGRDHYLLFLMRASAANPQIAGHYVLGPLEFPGALWEYIRCYMELGQPPLQADEAPPNKAARFDMMEALAFRRRNYWRDWKEFPWTQFWQHLCLPLFAVFLLVNRCVVWTAQKVDWPPEITEALGRPMTPADLHTASGLVSQQPLSTQEKHTD